LLQPAGLAGIVFSLYTSIDYSLTTVEVELNAIVVDDTQKTSTPL